MNSTLDDLLEEFKHAMRRKFETQREKARKRHGVGVVDSDFDWSHLNHQHFMDHLVEEVREWKEAELSGESTDVANEDVDVANMAFLDWVFHTLAEKKEEREEMDRAFAEEEKQAKEGMVAEDAWDAYRESKGLPVAPVYRDIFLAGWDKAIAQAWREFVALAEKGETGE